MNGNEQVARIDNGDNTTTYRVYGSPVGYIVTEIPGTGIATIGRTVDGVLVAPAVGDTIGAAHRSAQRILAAEHTPVAEHAAA